MHARGRSTIGVRRLGLAELTSQPNIPTISGTCHKCALPDCRTSSTGTLLLMVHEGKRKGEGLPASRTFIAPGHT
eukprot:1150011-Pelagomonas_calceolata.AAC.2